ncbi:DUF6397 family protein [Streptomyces sp. CA-181903]|uniref:DUF6397 family protein n=1 Tax=Streptomyces sp. CA-181903 TaxID=3240055 RepID=UPI003D8EC2D9
MADRCMSGSAAEGGVPFGRAARELGLKIGELDLAVQVGEVRTVMSGPEGPRRIRGEDIERHRSAEGFPDALWSRLRTVGTAEGAELAGIAPARFTRLARGGLLVPARFWINRYGAVVWRYLASDVVEFAERRPDLLTGRLPADLRAAADDGGDRRGVRWRGLRVEQLTTQAGDPWQRAAAAAAVLSPVQLVPAVPDPAERAWISALRPALTSVRPSAPAGRAAVEGLVFADGPDEVAHYQARVRAALTVEARGYRALPESVDIGSVGAGVVGAGPESVAGDGVVTAVGGGGRPLVPSPDVSRGAEASDGVTAGEESLVGVTAGGESPVGVTAGGESPGGEAAGAASGDRTPPSVRPSAGEPGVVEGRRAAEPLAAEPPASQLPACELPAADAAASHPPPSSDSHVPCSGSDALGADVPAQPTAPGGTHSVWRVLDRLLARSGRPGTAGRRERSAGWLRTVPGRAGRRSAGRPARRHPADAGARRRSPSERISGRP